MGSITIGNITFSWTGTFTTGTFVDGLPWLYLPSGTVSMSEPTPAQGTYNGYQTNGAELNPVYANEQGFSDMHATFNGSRTQTSWPVTMSAGDILVKSISDVGWSTLGNVRRRGGMYTEFCALYIVDAIPGAEDFAPAAIGWTGRGTLRRSALTQISGRIWTLLLLPFQHMRLGRSRQRFRPLRRSLTMQSTSSTLA